MEQRKKHKKIYRCRGGACSGTYCRVFFRALCKADVSNDVLEVFDDDVTNAAGAVSEWLKSLH